jgi:DNA (cytosine-5)-methyltransferase 1
MNLYNEIDPYAAQWMRNLIAEGHIPPGVVDERSIEDITPDELAGFTQCHFFAGLGGWPLALRMAGVPDTARLWTGSCPCQPFSAAGKGGGFADERHLWPAFDWLIGQCRPDLVLGEQVEGPAGRTWLDLVATDLEGHGYAFGTAVFPAAGVGTPQIRHRTYWVARSDSHRLEGQDIGGGRTSQRGEASRLARADEGQRGRRADGQGCECDGAALGWQQGDGGAGVYCEAGGVADSERLGWGNGRQRQGDAQSILFAEDSRPDCELPSPVNGFWRASDWIYCRDYKWRPVEPGTFPLASGSPARVGRLRAYGNAICVPQAVAFVEAVLALPTELHGMQK